MHADPIRAERTAAILDRAGIDAFVCALPRNVLMLSGYWPVLGRSFALAGRNGRVALVVPEGERDLALAGHANAVYDYREPDVGPGPAPARTREGALGVAAHALGVYDGRLGYESGLAVEPACYVAMHLYGGRAVELLAAALPAATLFAVDSELADLATRLTPGEVARVDRACRIAGRAFAAGARALRPGLTEVEAAARFREPLAVEGTGFEGVARSDGYVFCMSGRNAALAAPFARSTLRRIEEGDLALVHCNSHADGFWTDVTRTYAIGAPDAEALAIFEAVAAAREAALAAIAPGVAAAEVDRAARETLAARGFARQIRHGVGHGVGFAAIDRGARPRLAPDSLDVLDVGMTFTVAPAVYVEGYGAVRHSDVVTLDEAGPRVLSPFQTSRDELVVEAASERRAESTGVAP